MVRSASLAGSNEARESVGDASIAPIAGRRDKGLHARVSASGLAAVFGARLAAHGSAVASADREAVGATRCWA
jgi:hypothetical protein